MLLGGDDELPAAPHKHTPRADARGYQPCGSLADHQLQHMRSGGLYLEQEGAQAHLPTDVRQVSEPAPRARLSVAVRGSSMPVGAQAQPTDTREPPGYRRASAARSVADYCSVCRKVHDIPL